VDDLEQLRNWQKVLLRRSASGFVFVSVVVIFYDVVVVVVVDVVVVDDVVYVAVRVIAVAIVFQYLLITFK
jgi:hypothetical protein